MLGDPVLLLCWLLKRTSLSPEGPVPSWLCSLSPGSWALGKRGPGCDQLARVRLSEVLPDHSPLLRPPPGQCAPLSMTGAWQAGFSLQGEPEGENWVDVTESALLRSTLIRVTAKSYRHVNSTFQPPMRQVSGSPAGDKVTGPEQVLVT